MIGKFWRIRDSAGTLDDAPLEPGGYPFNVG
jgi:hypothetical protein